MRPDPIDDLLAGPPRLPDDGFTLQVMAALPPARPATWPTLRWLPLLGAGAVAALLAPEAAGLGPWLAAGTADLGGGLAQALTSAAGLLPVPLAALAGPLALAAAAVGSWLVAEPS
jgi:hypothetical protein